jgi:hypothetical protein
LSQVGLAASWLSPGRIGKPVTRLARRLLYLLIPPISGVIALACYAGAVARFSAFAVGLLTAAAALMAGGLLGFLFGLPRSVASGGGRRLEGWFRSSTSLEEIADWLTKILVGLGLVELGKLVHLISRLVDFIGPSLGPASASDSRGAVALGILGLFSISGFLLFYLATRLLLAPAFAHAEEQLRTQQADIQVAQSQIRSLVESDEPPEPVDQTERKRAGS